MTFNVFIDFETGEQTIVPLTEEELAERAALEGDAKKESVRNDRDYRLSSEVDPLSTNALRWSDLTAEKQAEWSAYRKLLLDVPQQAGFPDDVTWPTKPE